MRAEHAPYSTWASGRLTPDEEKALAGLALAHHITAEEEARIRKQVLSGLENVSAIDEEVEASRVRTCTHAVEQTTIFT